MNLHGRQLTFGIILSTCAAFWVATIAQGQERERPRRMIPRAKMPREEIRLPVDRDGSYALYDWRAFHVTPAEVAARNSVFGADGWRRPSIHLLILGGTDGSPLGTEMALALYASLCETESEELLISCIPAVDAPRCLFAGEEDQRPAARDLHLNYPPSGEAYGDPVTGPRHAVWRTIGISGPDFVVELRDASIDGKDTDRAGELEGQGLSEALLKHIVGGVGPTYARQYMISPDDKETSLEEIRGKVLEIAARLIPSHASETLAMRQSLTPRDTTRLLLKQYGQKLPEIHYIPALAVAARLDHGIAHDRAEEIENVVKIVSENLRRKPEPPLQNGSHIAGHLLLAKLARTPHPSIPEELRAEAKRLVLRAADLGWDAEGNMLPVMPFHNQMSDAVFMAGPILVEAYHLTGDRNYLEMADRNLRQIQKWCLREDGLYRHSPLDDAAWGRGNGFPALGLAWMLDELPPNDPRYDASLKMYQEHMAALASHQNKLGMWHQAIDKLDSYQEYTATCMIAWAMSRGVRNGWLEKQEYTPRIERAWQAILRRTGSDGQLIDVCTGTGKQKDLESYYNRTAILGRDDRGGAMGLLFAIEMAIWPEPTPEK